jgi:AcrR family transcriptional regulator
MPPITKPPTSPESSRASLAEMRPETLQRLEKAVLKLFSEQDFGDVSLLEVAKQANVSLQTIYKYFGSKEALVYAMLDVMLRRLAARMIDHLQGIEDVRERLRKTFWVMLDYMDRQPEVMKLLNTALPVQRFRNIPIYESPDLINAFLGVLKDGQQRGVLNNRVSSKVLLDVFLGIVGRVAHMHILREEAHPLLDQFDELFGMLWRALAMPPEAPPPPDAAAAPAA